MSHVFLTVYLIADGGYEDGHEGADQVEDAIGQIGQGGYSKHGGIGSYRRSSKVSARR